MKIITGGIFALCLAAGSAQADTISYTPFPVGNSVDTQFRWKAGDGPAHGSGGRHVFAPLYAPVLNSPLQPKLKRNVVPGERDERAGGFGNDAGMHDPALPPRPNASAAEIAWNGIDDRYRQRRIRVDPGVAAAVPLPASGLALAAGMLALIGLRGRRRRA